MVLHLSEILRGIFLKFEGAVHNDFVYAAAIIAWVEALTAIAAAYVKRMIPLRTMAMLANVFGVASSLGSGSLSGLIKHTVNLPLNAVRLREMRRLTAKVRQAADKEWNIEWLKPFMHPRALKAGADVFSRGDEASEAFVLVDGRVIIPEKLAVLEAGALFGEMALFTDSGKRTASAVCATNVRLLVITYEQFEQLYFQNPEFGLYLIRLIVRRLREQPGEIE
ncbi:MAG: cyclic nucleotide-binding domain-containing protein [Methylocapsa sp.]|nr:cyclic nucleotide-binding domain-containing protein [Methylocapsa sp.]